MCTSPMERDMLHHQEHIKAMRELDEFKQCITSIVENYIKMIDDKMSKQDLKINTSIVYIKDNLSSVAKEKLNELVESGEITIEGSYDTASESLSLVTDVNETTLSNFYYDDRYIVFANGMTWREFVASVYNVDGHFTETNGSIHYDGLQIAHLRSYDPYEYATVSPNDQIKNKAIYVGV